MNPRQRARNIEGVFVCVSRTGNRVSDERKSCYLHEGRPNGRVQRGLVLEAQAAGGGVVQMLVKKELVSQEGKPGHANHRGRESVRFLSDKILSALVLADRKARNGCSGSGERKGRIRLSEDVAKIQDVAGR
jgi:hypothetical protein